MRKRRVWTPALLVVMAIGCAYSSAKQTDSTNDRQAVELRKREADAEPAYREAVAKASKGEATRTLDAIEAALRAGACPTRVLTEPAFAGLHFEPRFRELIREFARQSSTVLVVPDEPGTSMIVSGRVRDEAGNPIANALLLVFHADVKGEYTPTKPMDEPHSRIFGYRRTDEQGQYQFRTVRPGGYQNAVLLGGKDRLIPAHIHFEVSADGFEPARFQMVFDDDPRMDDHLRKTWSPSIKAPIVVVSRDDSGGERCSWDIVLGPRSNPD